MSQALQTFSQETALVSSFPNLDISRALATIQTAITALTNRIDNIDTINLARVLNSRITAPDTPLEVVSNTTGQNIDALLNFYKLPNTVTVENRCETPRNSAVVIGPKIFSNWISLLLK
ncbi:24_t:CDS:2 [Paraglomus brasilianum]|uniref:24_t:CDS:1 n=1 Tax=Paraglomus brasilianum TaxID=144538 RepID=A0A9N9H5I7_9GLOM|nr:24_t:CDS:2 [Paraglomus brasilianum]